MNICMYAMTMFISVQCYFLMDPLSCLYRSLSRWILNRPLCIGKLDTLFQCVHQNDPLTSFKKDNAYALMYSHFAP